MQLRRLDPPTRRAIIAATNAIVAEHGYAALTLEAICARAGVDERRSRRHFESAEDAFCVSIEDGTNELLKRALPAFAAQPAWVDALRAVAYLLRDFLVEDPDRARAMVVESYSASQRSRRTREEGMEALAALIDFGRGGLEDPNAISPATARLTAGAVYNRIHQAVENDEPLTDTMVRELMYTAVRPYLGSAGALLELTAPRFELAHSHPAEPQ